MTATATASATAPATRAPKERLTLTDTTDLLEHLRQWVEDHVDVLELNGGALPDDLAAMLDEIVGAQRDKADAIAAKLDEFAGLAFSAKATKDRAARREKVWNNTVVAMKTYVLRQLDRLGVDRIQGKVSVLRRQTNGGQPEVTCAFSDEDLLAVADYDPAWVDEPSEPKAFALMPYLVIERTPKLDKKKLVEAYTTMREQLAQAAQTIGEEAISDEQWRLIDEYASTDDGGSPAGQLAEAVSATIQLLRDKHVADGLAAAFPGITVSRGSHLRID